MFRKCNTHTSKIYMFIKYKKLPSKIYFKKFNRRCLRDVDVLPQWEQIHISLEKNFLKEDMSTLSLVLKLRRIFSMRLQFLLWIWFFLVTTWVFPDHQFCYIDGWFLIEKILTIIKNSQGWCLAMNFLFAVSRMYYLLVTSHFRYNNN